MRAPFKRSALAVLATATACRLSLTGTVVGDSDATAVVDAGADAAVDAFRDAPIADTAPEAKANYALSFDGGRNFVVLLRQVSDDFTIEAWIRTAASRMGKDFFAGLPIVYADGPGLANDFGASILNDKFSFGL